MDGFTKSVGKFVAEARFENLPAKVVEIARLGITDFVGVALAGSKEELSGKLLRYISELGGTPQASVIGAAAKTQIYQAALVNGAIGHALDYDDWSIAVWGHPSVVLAPAVLALGEALGASGREILTAYVVGFETWAAIPWVVKKDHYDRGWHITGTIGALGAAAACCSLLRLDPRQVAVALGIAASLAAGIRANNGTMTKPLHAGQAAANGVQAALLAQYGFTAIENIFEAPRGFAKAFGHDGYVNWEDATKDLGRTFALAGPEGLIIKPYPSCGGTHFAIDAVLDIMKERHITLEEIAEIELGVNPLAELPLIYHRPTTGLEAKFSLEYTVARALTSGCVNLEHFTDEAVNQPQIKSLMEKMKWVVKYPMPETGAAAEFDPKSVTVKLRTGEVLFREVLVSKGMPQNPLTPEEFSDKYRTCARRALPTEKVEVTLTMLTNLHEIGDVREVMEALRSH